MVRPSSHFANRVSGRENAWKMITQTKVVLECRPQAQLHALKSQCHTNKFIAHHIGPKICWREIWHFYSMIAS